MGIRRFGMPSAAIAVVSSLVVSSSVRDVDFICVSVFFVCCLHVDTGCEVISSSIWKTLS